MMYETLDRPKKKPVNLTIREDIIADAKDLKINASRAAEAGIAAAVKEEKIRQFQEENKDAIEAHNRRVQERGILVRPYWARGEGTW